MAAHGWVNDVHWRIAASGCSEEQITEPKYFFNNCWSESQQSEFAGPKMPETHRTHQKDDDRQLGLCPDAIMSAVSILPGHSPAPLTLEWLIDRLALEKVDWQ